MAPIRSLFKPKQLLFAGVLAGVAVVLPAAATFGKVRARQVLARPGVAVVPAPAAGPPAVPLPLPPPAPLDVPEIPTDAFFYNIPPRYMDPERLAQIKCDSGATTEDTPGLAAVNFAGHVAFQSGRFPEELPTPTFLRIELQDGSPGEKIEDRPLLYVHQQEVSEVYEEGEPIPFSFCAKVPEVEQYGLYARVVSAAADGAITDKPIPQLSFAGLTDIEAGLKEYKSVRVLLFNAISREVSVPEEAGKDEVAADAPEKVVEDEPFTVDKQSASDVDAQRPTGDPLHAQPIPNVNSVSAPAQGKAVAGVEICKFSRLPRDIHGVAARVIMEVPPSFASKAPLPKPTVLTVLLEEFPPHATAGEVQMAESEPLAVFSSDITAWYEAGEELNAVLCARVPANPDKREVTYRLRSLVNVGWDGYEESDKDEAPIDPEAAELVQKLRIGDYMAETTLVVVPENDTYIVRVPLVPFGN